MQSATLDTATRLRADKIEALLRVSRAMATEIHLNDLLRVIMEQATSVVEAERSSLLLYDESRDELWGIVAQGLTSVEIRFPSTIGLAGYVARTGERLNVADAYADSRFNPAFDERTGYRTRSVLCMPVVSRDQRLLGVIQVLNKRHGEAFSEEDEMLLEAFCSHAAVALERARLVEAYVEQQRLQEALRVAHHIQQDMLPDGDSVPARQVDLHAHLSPAQSVGGDLYDFFMIDEHRFGFALGDVSGKGLPASLFMAGTQTLLRASGRQGLSPAGCLKTINEVQRNRSSMFVTLFYGVLDLRTGRVDYGNAGHLPPFLVRRNGLVSSFRRAKNLPLGLIRSASFREGHMLLGAGDTLVLVSDGISEAANTNGEMFGLERIHRVLTAQSGRSAAEIVQHVLDAVNRFTEGAPRHDDQSMLVIRFLGGTPGATRREI